MLASRLLLSCAACGMLAASSGCLAPASQVNALKAENSTLVQRNNAQSARIENLEIHARTIEDQLMRAEEELALLDERCDLQRQQLSNSQQQRDQLHNQFMGLLGGRHGMSAEMSRQLADISERYPALCFDPYTGISKLDTDILFDTGQADVKQGAEGVLTELVRVLNSPEGRDLKVMVVGHTDNQLIAGRPTRQQHPNNFHLSASRALAVADLLGKAGLPSQRIGVASFGPHQPIAPNVTSKDRQKNRRVELFVMAPDVPVVGWVESTPTLY